MPNPLSHPTTIYSNSSIWNVTLAYNLEYMATISSINCAGKGSSITLYNIKYCEYDNIYEYSSSFRFDVDALSYY